MTTTTHDDVPRFLTMTDVQRAFGETPDGKPIVSLRHVQRMAANSEIPGVVRVGRRYLVQRVPFTAWVEGGGVARVVPMRRPG